METEEKSLSKQEITQILTELTIRWQDPVKKAEDIFNIRDSKGNLKPYRIPEPQKELLRDGILGRAKEMVEKNIPYVSVCLKGRQMGFSVVLGAEAILIADKYGWSNIYYVATSEDQALDWIAKVQQLIQDSNSFPPELGGGKILNITDMTLKTVKEINNTKIFALTASPMSIHGKTGIAVIFDEAALAIRTKNFAHEIWKALRYIVRQGGSARIQSTPRTSDPDEFFWGMLTKGNENKGGIKSFTFPVISNWEDLNLEEPLIIPLDDHQRELLQYEPLHPEDKKYLQDKYNTMGGFEVTDEYIKQPAIIEYPWISLQDLENERATDMERFMQQNLCRPIDESLKVILSEWIFANAHDEEYEYRPPGNNNEFFMCIDFAQKNDVTAIVITEKDVNGTYWERYKKDIQGDYTLQMDTIFKLYLDFKPKRIGIDHTGPGIPLYDMMCKKFRDNGAPINIIEPIVFTIKSKEEMALGFKNLVQPHSITNENRYKFLWRRNNRQWEEAIRHITRVEKETLANSSYTRYTGKKYGRDDYFWASSELVLIDNINIKSPTAFFGRIKKENLITKNEGISTIPKNTIAQLQKLRDKKFVMLTDTEKAIEAKMKENKSKINEYKYRKSLNFVLECLTKSPNFCLTLRRMVKSVHCASPHRCDNPKCPSYKYVEELCQRYNVKKEDIEKWQKEFK